MNLSTSLRSFLVCASIAGTSQAAVINLFVDDMPTVGSSTPLPLGNWTAVGHINNVGTAASVTGGGSAVAINDGADPGSNSSRIFGGTNPSVTNSQKILFARPTQFDAAVTASQSIGDYSASSWTISYYSRNDGTPAERLVLKVGTQWYLRNAATPTDTTYGTGGTDAAGWTKYLLANPFGTSGWTPIAFDDVSSTSLERITSPAGASVLPTSGLLNGIGTWGQKSTGTFGMRLDLVTISAEPIPEPATFGLLAAATLLGGRRRRAM